ncbi:MAG: hypothetical protein JWN04_6584 [Myxococcaceae bacterium]|nr:hypothetical protein [Myxococcaceae bacterium]
MRRRAILTGTDSARMVADHAINSMKKEAAKLGANGIVMGDVTVDGWSGASMNGKAVYVP